MRTLLAAILGAVVMFIWNFVAHELLPLGELGVGEIPNEDVVTSAIQSSLGNKIGFYFFPGTGLPPDATRAQKREAMQKIADKMALGPAGVLIYHPKRVFNFPERLGIEFGTEFIESLVLVILLVRAGIGCFVSRIGFILAAGFVAAITTNIPYWNWYGFPRIYTCGYMLTQLIGFLSLGIVAGLILGKKTEPAAAA
jgi:hypothetical protein